MDFNKPAGCKKIEKYMNTKLVQFPIPTVVEWSVI